jgi:hypothetical protein
MTADLTNRILGNRYQLIQEIGSGGMGSVFRALDLHNNGQEVAVKILYAPMLLSRGDFQTDLRRRFAEEIRVSTLLGQHPRIVKVLDHGQEGEQAYLVMEYLKGQDLGKLIREKGALPVRQAVRLALQACEGLHFAHTFQAKVEGREIRGCHPPRHQTQQPLHRASFSKRQAHPPTENPRLWRGQNPGGSHPQPGHPKRGRIYRHSSLRLSRTDTGQSLGCPLGYLLLWGSALRDADGIHALSAGNRLPAQLDPRPLLRKPNRDQPEGSPPADPTPFSSRGDGLPEKKPRRTTANDAGARGAAAASL